MLKIHQRKNKICWLHVQWDAPTFKCAHSAGRLCRNCFANASTGTRPHSPPFPEQLCVSLLHLCKSQQMNTSWVHSHKHAELLLQHLSCSLQQRPQTKTKSTRSTVQSSAVESKSTLNCSLQNNNGKKYNKKKKASDWDSTPMRTHGFVTCAPWLEAKASEPAQAGQKPLRLCEYLWVSMSHFLTGKTSSPRKPLNCTLAPVWAWFLIYASLNNDLCAIYYASPGLKLRI